MLHNYKEATTITAVSMVAVIDGSGEEKQVQAAYMSANIDDSGNVSITKSITNKEAYSGNRLAVRKDFGDFETAVYAAEDGGVG